MPNPPLQSHGGEGKRSHVIWTVQPADVRQGMINIRSEDDASPENVLDDMTPEQAAKVPFLSSSAA